ncbi:DivIVA domain-containing protein [Micromonospora sp. NPDC047074]|uniref:DivIVA domain-containing protein n=1 Tax=Micromonospora sp. NPDC047074 TaxID=3154339 RepID=UPI0034081FAF
MGQVLLLLVVALTVAAVVFGVTVLVTGRDPGLAPAEPDGRAVPLPAARPLREADVGEVRFDTALRGYRMEQVDQAMRRAAYDVGYKSELIGVLEAEVAALREGRTADADALRSAREQAAGAAAAEQSPQAGGTVPVDADRAEPPGGSDIVVEPIPAFAGAGSAAGDEPPAGGGVGGRRDDATAAGAGDGGAADRSATGKGGPADRDGGDPGAAGDDGAASPAGDEGRSDPVVRSESK